MNRISIELTEETIAALPRAGTASRYLAVFEPSSSRVVHLADDGELIVGRGEGVAVSLEDVGVSRRHARIVLTRDSVVVVDLESQHGTRVDGERVVDACRLAAGSVVEIGHSTLVFHDRPSAAAVRIDAVPFREMIARELERARFTGRGAAVFFAEADSASDPRALGPALASCLVAAERALLEGSHAALVFSPETDREAATHRAEAFVAACRASGLRVRLGVACSPDDGLDEGTLIATARAAAAVASEGKPGRSDDAARVLDLGTATALVADAAMLRVYALAERLAAVDLPVLIHGETGTGKELLAAAVHRFSPRRRAQRLVSINCATLKDTLAESELFGHEKGAYTGATTTKQGLLEVAKGGTVFLDEIAELSPEAQAKLLRALDSQRIVRLGDTVERPIDVRIVAATHRELAAEVSAGRFRSDLYFRLSGATLWIPPLRDRPRELVLLARRFLDAACDRAGVPHRRTSDDFIHALAAHPFPGNVRELRHVMEFLVAAYDDPILEAFHLEQRLHGAPGAPDAPRPARALAAGFRPIEDEVRELEMDRMRRALAEAQGNQRRAAQLIAMPLRTFVTKLARYGLR